MSRLYDMLEVDFFHEDEKGRLLQLVHDGYKQINVITTQKGKDRGDHYHKNTEEAFFIIEGKMIVRFSNGGFEETREFSKNDFFVIHPYVNHYMTFPEDCVMIAMYTNPVELPNGTKDIHYNGVCIGRSEF